MKTIRLKTTCYGMDVRTTLAHPSAPLGDYREATVQIREVVNVPPCVNPVEVIRLFASTADMTPFYGEPRLVFDYNELGLGRIIR